MKHIRMEKADWEKWDAALRSGDYEQGPGCLKNDNKYCCLGVLEMCLSGEVELEGMDIGIETDPIVSAGLPSNDWLEAHRIEFFDKNDNYAEDPFLSVLGVGASIANDGDFRGSEILFEPKTFLEIADAIKEEVDFTDA